MIALTIPVALTLVALGAAATASAAPGATWVKQAPLPTPNDLASVDMISACEGWAVGQVGTILHTADGGATWIHQASGTSEPLNAVRFLDPSHGWAVGNVMLWTDDGGDSWHRANSVPASNYGVDFVDLNKGWAVGGGGIVYRTADGGRNWVGSASSTSQNLMAVDFVNANRGWAVGGRWRDRPEHERRPDLDEPDQWHLGLPRRRELREQAGGVDGRRLDDPPHHERGDDLAAAGNSARDLGQQPLLRRRAARVGGRRVAGRDE